MAKVLVVDDNPDILDALDLLLSLHGHTVFIAKTALDALSLVRQKSLDLVIQDMNFSIGSTAGDEGELLFNQIRKLQNELPIILLTAWTSLDSAVRLVKAGAKDYLPKPWDDAKLVALVDEYTKQSVSPQTNANAPTLVYNSEVMRDLVHRAKKIAQVDANVLIGGPNGAGKERLAELIHQASSRAKAPLVKVNMGALPENLMEAELFGAEKGAFTGASESRIGRFETANNGTLFLDEIGNLSLTGQMKLLRVLQTGEFERIGSSVTKRVNVRVISATNADLSSAVAAGQFREDLFYRLNTFELTLPALNQRGDDVILLAEHFLPAEYQLSDDAKNLLRHYAWPGNVRELENACQRAALFAASKHLHAVDFALDTQPTLDEREHILQCLEKHNWVIQQAAKELNLSRQALYRRIEKYALEKPC